MDGAQVVHYECDVQLDGQVLSHLLGNGSNQNVAVNMLDMVGRVVWCASSFHHPNDSGERKAMPYQGNIKDQSGLHEKTLQIQIQIHIPTNHARESRNSLPLL